MEKAMNLVSWYFVGNRGLNNIPQRAGVYIIATNNVVKYVGQARDLNGRSQQHFSISEDNYELRNHINQNRELTRIYWAEVSLQSERDGIELFLYKRFNPPFNKVTPPTIYPIVCNLP